jgi:UDP-N-acetylmuramate--alanine ligase
MSNQAKRIHFIGIGGIGMSGLARFWLHEGAVVSGSDAQQSELTEALTAEGATIFYEQVPENITGQGFGSLPDLVVFTEAMPHDHPELAAAREAGITTINYFEGLGQVANEYYLIAVAGSHGKSTTTAMLIDILERANLDPTAIVGTLRSKTGSNFRAGKSKYAIVEACEYKRDFLYLKPDVLVITNIDHEHVDYYKTLADVQDAFRTLAETVPETGAVVANAADPHVTPVVAGLVAPVLDYRSDISLTLSLKLPGLHNRQNAAAAKAAARFLGIDEVVIDEALTNFAGTWRRFEYRGTCNDAAIYDDYAHNPQKVAAAISGTRELYPDQKITVVFQPHTYSRTKVLFQEFVSALAAADRVVLLPIYAAREDFDASVSSLMLRDALHAEATLAEHYDSIDAAIPALKSTIGASDVVLCVGAGSVTKVADLLTEA